MSRGLAWCLAGWLVLLAFMPRPLAMLCTAPSAVVAALLMFYSSFMILGGLRLIGRQPLDLRATFVLGVSLTLALSTGLVHNPVQASMPRWLQTITGSMLTVGMLSSLFLTVLFRIGVRKQRSFRIQVNDGAPTEVVNQVEKVAEGLGAQPAAVHEAARLASSLIHRLRERSLATGEVEVRISYDRLRLELELRYPGRPLTLAAYSRPGPEDLVDENVFASGLSSYMDEVHPDEFSVHVEGQFVRLLIAFDVG